MSSSLFRGLGSNVQSHCEPIGSDFPVDPTNHSQDPFYFVNCFAKQIHGFKDRALTQNIQNISIAIYDFQFVSISFDHFRISYHIFIC